MLSGGDAPVSSDSSKVQEPVSKFNDSWVRKTNDARTRLDNYSPLAKPLVPNRDRRNQTQMNFYKAID